MATIQDVANRAGVSTATVSHVLNNTRYVSAETREAVLKAIRELHYYPSAVARSLSTQETRTIGMMVSDITNIFFGEIVRGVVDVISPLDYQLILCTTEDEVAREEQYFDLLLSRRVDGLIAAATSRKWTPLQVVESQHIPVVFVDKRFEGMKGPFVGADNTGGAYTAVSHLIADGHTRIAVVAGLAGMSSMEERVEGYRRALQERGLPIDESLIVYGPLSVEGGQAATKRLLTSPDPPQAIFSNNNLLTLGTLLAIKDLGLRCPDDVALACFDDHPWAAVASPAPTVVRQPDYEIGRTAAGLLMRMLAGESLAEEQILFKPELIVRESCRSGPHS